MFTHVRVASSDLEKSRAFYDATLATLGVPAGVEMHGMIMYKHAGNHFALGKPLEGEPTYSNGGTIGFAAANAEEIDRFHAVGLANGGTCEGKPGPRGQSMYGAYLRDPDGNKICSLMIRG